MSDGCGRSGDLAREKQDIGPEPIHAAHDVRPSQSYSHNLKKAGGELLIRYTRRPRMRLAHSGE